MEEIKILKLEDKNYPNSLKVIKNPPKTLYYRGKLLKEEKLFAIVGSRKCSEYGKEMAFKLAEDLALAGLTIISGLAEGIDTFSHLGAVKNKRRTIAVLGTGLDEDSMYPKSNIGLANEILKTGGCLLSEYPTGTKGSRITFPKRNRIISGISLGILVVEAKMKSGTIITANWARKQGKKIFVLAGANDYLACKGINSLVKKGAIRIKGSNDILKRISL